MLIALLLQGLFRAFPLTSFSLPLFSFLPPQLVRELLHEGQAISVGVSAESGRGGQWLARIRQLIKEGSVPDVCLVPVGISYDCVPKSNIQVKACKHTLASTHKHHLTRAICNVLRSKWTGLEHWFSNCRCSTNNRKLVIVVQPADLAHLSTYQTVGAAAEAVTNSSWRKLRNFKTLSARLL